MRYEIDRLLGRGMSCVLSCVGTFAVGTASRAVADVRLPSIVGDNMVLQQNSDVAVWGWASPGEKVVVRGAWGDSSKEVVADEHGKWRSSLRTPKAGGPFRVTVAGNNTLTLNNVMIGEVWVCSGQSNMEWRLEHAEGGTEAVKAATHKNLRFFMVKNTVAARPMEDCVPEGGGWRECVPESAAGFSAVGYFFARELQSVIDVPVGLISADWGGTPAEAWTSARALRQFPEFTARLDQMEALSADPNERLQKAEDAAKGWWSAIDTHKDGAGVGWAGAAFDDSSWKTLKLPQTLVADELDAFDGVVYFRRTIDIPTGFEHGAVLEIGPIDDMDDAYVNGVLVGATHEDGQWNTARSYRVAESLLSPGRVTIAARMYDHSGLAGINGKPEQMVLRSTHPKLPAQKLAQKAGDVKAVSIALAGEWKYKVGPAKAAMAPIPRMATVDAYTPTALYNGMVAPIIPYAIKGVIWYQGESNRNDPARYRTLFPAMIRNWREDWGRGEFSFYFAQIAPFTYGGDQGQTAEIREAQLMTLSLPNTGMAVTMDVGNLKDIHPTKKLEVAERLALWALARDYGRTGVEWSGPLFKSATVKGGKIGVEFEHAESGLLVKGDRLTHVQIAGEDRRFMDAQVLIVGSTLVLSHPSILKPVAVRYGWCDACEPNLFNNAGLPASPFRSDDWPLGDAK